MSRIANSIELAKTSWSVLKADKELLFLPVISAIASLVTIATFIAPLFASGAISAESEDIGAAAYVVLFVLYVALAFITVFFNAALVFAANERLEGGDPTVKSALAGARGSIGLIFQWALVSATVSIILRTLEERAGLLGRLVIGFIGMAWAVVTYLVLPLLVLEGYSVKDALSESASMFKQTWGENLSAQIGFGILGFVASLPGIALIVLGIFTGSGITIAIFVTLGIAWLALVAVVMSALAVVFQTALYRYARDGSAPGAFDTRSMNTAFMIR
jgi:uncharacterized protein DUF6159